MCVQMHGLKKKTEEARAIKVLRASVEAVYYRLERLLNIFERKLYRLALTYFDKERLGVIFKDTNPRVVGSIHDPRKCCFPRGDTWAEEHCTDGRACRNRRVT